MPGSYLVAGARTPIGKMSGALASFSAVELGGIAIKAALERAGIAPDQVDYVFMGQVLMANQGQIPARQAAYQAGVPLSTPATSVNKVCLSGLNTIYLADQMIAAGEADVVVAGGMESMTNAPYLLPGARSGFRYGNTELLDAIIRDGLWCAFEACLMGAGTERYANAELISRDSQDEAAAKSHERPPPPPDGRFVDEIVRCPSPAKGDPLLVETDEGMRPGTTRDLGGSSRPSPATAASPPATHPRSRRGVGHRGDVRRRAGRVPLGEFVAMARWPDPTTCRCCTSQPGHKAAPASQPAGRLSICSAERGVRRRRAGVHRRPASPTKS
jgi:acetyl-CoA C-acetyltransferase